VAATVTRALEVQQMEMSRAEWKAITSVLPSEYKHADEGHCQEDNRPINNVTWWEAITAANLLSEQRGLEYCYELVNCTSELGKGLACEAVAEPEESVYDCEGYRLGTRAEAEYAAKAGTYSTWYSGNITVYDNNDCNFDENLDKIGWYCFNSSERVHVRGQKEQNGFGLQDLIGNAGEWLNEESRTTAAEGGNDPRGTVGKSKDRQIFGGAYNARAWTSKTSGLFAAAWDVRGGPAGFRLYRTLFEDSERSKAIVEP
jgi:formylglycine-generating enzyme required for sulfatase activity